MRPQARLLAEFLHNRGVTEVDVCGIAADYCVDATARDAASAGFATTVLTDLTAAVHPESMLRLRRQWADAGLQTRDTGGA